MGGQYRHIQLHMKSLRTSRLSLLVPLATALMCALAPLQSQALQMRGFRGLMWGDPPAHLGSAALITRDGEVQCYQRERENLLFGDTELRAVRYCFHRERLFMVVLEPVNGIAALRAEFERGYGAPDKVSGSAVQWGLGSDSISAEIAAPAAGTPASLRLLAREFSR
jgi:hypothetical protein